MPEPEPEYDPRSDDESGRFEQPKSGKTLFGSWISSLWRWFDGWFDVDQPALARPIPKTVVHHSLASVHKVGVIALVLSVTKVVLALGSALLPLLIGVTIDWVVVPAEEQVRIGLPALLLIGLGAVLIPPLIRAGVVLIYRLLLYPKLGSLTKRHMHSHLLRLDWGFFQRQKSGAIGTKLETLGLVTTDVVEYTLDDLIYLTVVIFGSLGLLLYVSTWLIIPVTLWVCAVTVIHLFLYPRLQALRQRAFDARSEINGVFFDDYSNALTVQLYGDRVREDPHVTAAVHKHVRLAQRSHALTWVVEQGTAMLNAVLIALLFTIALFLWYSGQTTAGAVAMILPLGLRITDLANHVISVVEVFTESAAEMAESLGTLAVEPDIIERPQAPELHVKGGGIDVKGLNFGYPGQEPLFTDMDFRIEPGQSVALVGPSGAGKSSIAALFPRLYDIDAGQILIDGQDIASVRLQSLRDHIAFVAQDISLFHRSVADNIRYGRPDATDAEVEAAAKNAEAHDFILELWDEEGGQGYNATVGERGVKLSGGQRQRISLARALIKDAPILILDEATASLDSASEARILSNLRHHAAGRTVVAIAHRLSTIRDFDRIFVIDRGAIIETGRHADLVAQDGLYAKLWRRQVSDQSGAF